jgi:hypothetical protein
MSERWKHWDLGDGVIGCGPKPPTEQDIAEIERFKRFLRGEMDAHEARVYAGLSLGQGADLLGVTRERLGDVEHGRAPLDDVLRAKMERVYGCGLARERPAAAATSPEGNKSR